MGDRDKDGVLDNVDKCPLVPGSISDDGGKKVICIKVIDSLNKITTKEDIKETKMIYVGENPRKFSCGFMSRVVYFESGKSELSEMIKKKLDYIAETMKKLPKTAYAIEGHVDSLEFNSKSKKLSRKRTKNVLSIL